MRIKVLKNGYLGSKYQNQKNVLGRYFLGAWALGASGKGASAKLRITCWSAEVCSCCADILSHSEASGESVQR